jgi:hypothetical protein
MAYFHLTLKYANSPVPRRTARPAGTALCVGWRARRGHPGWVVSTRQRSGGESDGHRIARDTRSLEGGRRESGRMSSAASQYGGGGYHYQRLLLLCFFFQIKCPATSGV